MLKLCRLRCRLAYLERKQHRLIAAGLRHQDMPSRREKGDTLAKQCEDLLYDIEREQSDQLRNEAERLDVEEPDYDDEQMWYSDYAQAVLSPVGRSHLRRLIDEEKLRRRDIHAWWWKTVVIPAVTAVTGLAGVVTGMIAVIHASK